MTAAPGPWTEDQLSHLYGLFYGEMSLCGCGRPGEAVALVGRLLNLAPFYDHISEVAGVFGGNAGVQHIVLSIMDEAGLIEHGGSIHGSWATVKGRAVRHLLSLGAGSDLDVALNCAGFPHDGWTLGSVKDPAGKTSPWLVPYCDLPARARERGRIYAALARALG